MLCALIGNAHRDPKKGRAFRPGDFDPYGRDGGETVQVDRKNIGLLKQAFTGPGRTDGRARQRKGVQP